MLYYKDVVVNTHVLSTVNLHLIPFGDFKITHLPIVVASISEFVCISQYNTFFVFVTAHIVTVLLQLPIAFDHITTSLNELSFNAFVPIHKKKDSLHDVSGVIPSYNDTQALSQSAKLPPHDVKLYNVFCHIP